MTDENEPETIDMAQGTVGVCGGEGSLIIQEPVPRRRNDNGSAPQFLPGVSGNPAGRPRGARSRLGTAFVNALMEDFNKHGVRAIQDVRTDDPSTYIRVIAGLLPKEITGEDGLPLLTNIKVTFVEPVNRG